MPHLSQIAHCYRPTTEYVDPGLQQRPGSLIAPQDSKSIDMTQGRCEACKLLSVCDIRDEGIVLHSDARTLLQNAAARDFVTADDRACDVCTTIWDSFQPDGLSRLLLDEISRGNVEVRLYRCTSKRMRDEKKYLRSRTLPSNEVDPVIQIAILLVPRTLSADLLRSGCVDENDYFFRFCGYIDWNEVWAFQKSPPSPGSKYANSYIWVYCGPGKIVSCS